jgi:DNA polymerase-3 subunit alpha
MHTAEDIGLEKFDILSQRGLGTIKDTVNLIKEKRGINVDIEDTRISKDEVKCNEFLSIGKTIGCFYIESPAMRGLLRRLNVIITKYWLLHHQLFVQELHRAE